MRVIYHPDAESELIRAAEFYEKQVPSLGGQFQPHSDELTCLDLFCGCGGFTLGMQRAGFEVLAAVDFNAEAVATLNAISKARTACEVPGHQVSDHFADVGKMVDLGTGSQHQIEDTMLTRYAC